MISGLSKWPNGVGSKIVLSEMLICICSNQLWVTVAEQVVQISQPKYFQNKAPPTADRSNFGEMTLRQIL